ncbi:MipA/OmpV family protein [Methylocella sp.]|uniref:MipA/OmpV family protein n=1 Tax=Methylocella sp. TaxID=1978226 RepID=UPI0035AE1912
MLEQIGAPVSSAKIRLLAGCATLALACGGARAADVAPTAPAPTGWILTVGVGPQVQTSFPGARSVNVWPTGGLGLRRVGEPAPFFSPDDGFGLALLDFGWFKAGPVGRIISSRGLSNGNGAFYGLHDIGTSVELGAFADIWPAQWLRLRGEVRQAVSGNDGLDANISIDGVYRYDAYTFALGPRLQFGDWQYMNAYFSVSQGEALANGKVGPYQASGGLASVGVAASIKYDYNADWSATLFGGYNRLVSAAASSPIPNNLGSLNQFTAGVVISRNFVLDSIPFLH